MNDLSARSNWLTRAKKLIPEARFLRRWRDAYRLWCVDPYLAGPSLLQAFARTYPSAFFIQIGANDGQQQDPLWQTARGTNWSGILVEPVPHIFARLQRNRGGQARVRLENSAIADQDGELPFYHLAQADDLQNLPSWYDGLGSFRRDVVLKHVSFIPDIEQRLICTPVPCLTFESLCRKHGVQDVDLILIDTEGYDFEIIQRIDFAQHRPRLLIYEHHHLGAEDKVRARDYLEQLGYDCFEEYLDTWCLDMGARMHPQLLRRWHRLKSRRLKRPTSELSG